MAEEYADIVRPDGWSPHAWASRLEYLAGQVEEDADRFGRHDAKRKLAIAARYRKAAKAERAQG